MSAADFEAMNRNRENQVRELYHGMLNAWNRADADAFAASFAEDGQVIGFDGSEMSGRESIRAELARIFTDHATGRYVGLVRSVHHLGSEVILLRAVSGVVPAGAEQLNPALNANQSLVARDFGESWKVCLYHNTPAAFHGRPDLSDALTADLSRELVRMKSTAQDGFGDSSQP